MPCDPHFGSPASGKEVDVALPAGWYPVNGDPAGTQRYWDGDTFTTGPKVDVNARTRSGFAKPNSASKWRMAGPMARLAAAIIDYGAPVIVVLGIASGSGTSIPAMELEAWTNESGLLAAILACYIINQVVLVGLFGVSLGRILVGLRVVNARDRDRPPGLFRALIRAVLQLPTLALTALLFALGKRQGVHDLAAGTAVVYV